MNTYKDDPTRGLSWSQKEVLIWAHENINNDGISHFMWKGRRRNPWFYKGSNWRTIERLVKRGLVQRWHYTGVFSRPGTWGLILTDEGKEIARLLSMKQIENGSKLPNTVLKG